MRSSSFMSLHGRTGGSDSVTEQPTQPCGLFATGKPLRVRYYDDRAEALEAAGLSE